jgi:hypothetical protein
MIDAFDATDAQIESEAAARKRERPPFNSER